MELDLITLNENSVLWRCNLLKSIMDITQWAFPFRLRGWAVSCLALLLLGAMPACNAITRTKQESLIRVEVEKHSASTKWNGLEKATASGNVELWASDFVQGEQRWQVLWIVWNGDGKMEVYPYPADGGFFVQECFGPRRPEVLGQALPLAIKYVEVLRANSQPKP